MELDKLTVEIRPRRAWEAVDLGVLMARRWWWSLLKVWFLVTFPLWAIFLFLPSDYLVWQMVLLWWLKPIYERPLLYMLSQAVFDRRPTIVDTLRAFPKLAVRQIILSLTWRRLSFSRSMDLPIIVLEGLSGEMRSKRIDILQREDSNPAFWLTIVGVLLESCLVIGCLMLIGQVLPDNLGADWYSTATKWDESWFSYVVSILAYIAIMLVAPFYVASGFALYLNRRIKLEAWDIEIAFRRLKQKYQQQRPSSVLGSCLLCLVLCLSAFNVETSIAADNEEVKTEANLEVIDEVNAEESQTLINEVLDGEAFHEKKIVEYPDLSWLFDEETEESEAVNLPDWFVAFLAWLAASAEIILWLVVIAIIAIVVYRYRSWFMDVVDESGRQQLKREKPKTVMGMEVTKDSLPDDVSKAALKLWHQGNKRQALALLYRASLHDLIERGADIREDHTERECLVVFSGILKLNNKLVPQHNYFSDLTTLWCKLAYGHIDLSDDLVVPLCESWNEIWRGGHARV